jgi:predicted GH43/DUF377 family glycosyl hydrolase
MTEAIRITHTGINLRPDVGRVVTRFFVPGREDVGPGDSRASSVIDRVLNLDEADVDVAMQGVDESYGGRHIGLYDIFRYHAELIAGRIDASVELSKERTLLLGAAFTHEYAIEGAALCNPSMVLAPHHRDDGSADFVMSVRGVGEGHRSSIGFRRGTVSATGHVTVHAPDRFPRTAAALPSQHHRSVFHTRLAQLDDDRENAAFVLDSLAPQFDDDELAAGIAGLAADGATRRHTESTIAHLDDLAQSTYRLEFGPTDDVSGRVLWPQSPAERHGMEDARFVRFTDDDGTVTYYGTYTAFDGINVAQHLLETTDFAAFSASPMAGSAAIGKGLALFPRKINGRYAALSRSDRETNAIAFSDDVRCWDSAQTIQAPDRPWEILQLGNCGSPIETAQGWLVLTHGVGVMRTYSIGVLLLDLDDPRVVLARSVDPIITPTPGHREGYVPNVVYTCGGFAHGDTLVLPYGIADQTITIATLSIRNLLAGLQPIV